MSTVIFKCWNVSFISEGNNCLVLFAKSTLLAYLKNSSFLFHELDRWERCMHFNKRLPERC